MLLQAAGSAPLQAPAVAGNETIGPWLKQRRVQTRPPPPPSTFPTSPPLKALKAALTQRWLDEGTYKFNPDTTREQVYSIDTPPPTASGSLHVGHMFSFTQTDVLARYSA